MKKYIILLCFCLSCSINKPLENDLGNHVNHMKTILASTEKPVQYFTARNFAVAAHTSEKTASRIRRYVETLLEEMLPYFGKSYQPIKLYIFDTKKNLAKHINAICEDDKKYGESMGFYNLKTRSALVSMEWGLGWVGDLVIRSLLADDLQGVNNKWFSIGFVSMLYNSFRTPEGDFKGMNVMSYYRPQVQAMYEKGLLAPLEKFLNDDYGKLKDVSDGSRKQGREFLAYIHSRGLLMDFYKKFVETCKTDPSGITAIETVTRVKIKDIETTWLKWQMAADGEISDSAMAKPFPVLGILIERKKSDDKGKGIKVFEVCHYSPARRAGILQRDIILKINDSEINSCDELIKYLDKQSIGANVTVVILRGNLQIELKATLDRFIDG